MSNDIFSQIAGAAAGTFAVTWPVDDHLMDVIVEITGLKLATSNKPATRGFQYFVFEGAVVGVKEGRREVGDVLGMPRYLMGPGADRNLREVGALCAAILGTTEATAQDIQDLIADDGALAKGGRIRIRTTSREAKDRLGANKTYYNPVFEHVSLSPTFGE